MFASGNPPAAETIPLSAPFDVPEVRYDPSVPTPEDTLGHRLGTFHTRPDQIIDYFRALDAASDRVVVRQHGRTHEGRALIHALVTSPSNHARLEELRRNNLNLSEDPTLIGENGLRAMPAVIYMGYSIHGNEASGSEAALLLLYHLAAGEGSPIETALKDLIILIDPMLNPDGRSRFVDWVNANRGRVATSDPQDREHNEPWPGGRTNHYWFDLNRDWLPAQQPESQARLDLFHAWRPQLLTDFHEMSSDSTFFFQPGVEARTHPLTPRETYDLTAEIGRYHARALDRIGSLYFTQETFDDFYYGKGSTYPDINGAVGILFEQASSRSLEREIESGTVSYGFTIRNQFAASLSSLEAAVSLREKLLRNQREFYRRSPEFAQSHPVKAYVISAGSDPTRARLLTDILRRHRIRIHGLRQPIELESIRFDPGSAFVVPVDQPQGRLVAALMETRTTFEDSIFYDVSTWTFPLAFGLEAAPWTEAVDSILGERIEDHESPEPAGGGRASYAYVMPWGRFYAPRALYRLQQEGIRCRVLMRPAGPRLAEGVVSLDRGSIIIPLEQESVTPQVIHDTVGRIRQQDELPVYALNSGLTAEGPELGSPSIRLLRQPVIGVLTGTGISASQAGEVWHLLNERMGIPVSLLNLEDFTRTEIERYNTLVLPGGSYQSTGKETAEKLKRWLHSGGVLIAIAGGAQWAVEQGVIDEQLRRPVELKPDLPYSEIRPALDAQKVAGSIFRARLDNSHPVAYGYPDYVALFRDHDHFFEPSQEPGANVALYGNTPLLSGYISERQLAALTGSAALIARRVGDGRVILFAEDPCFRAFWLGTAGLFLNAVFFGPVF